MTGTVLVTAIVTDAEPGYVGERLVARGCTLRTVLRERGEVPPIVPDGTAAVLLGSGWSVVGPVRPEVLDAETPLVRSAQTAGVPVLGSATARRWSRTLSAGHQSARARSGARGAAYTLVDAFAEVTSTEADVPARDVAQSSWAASRRTSP